MRSTVSLLPLTGFILLIAAVAGAPVPARAAAEDDLRILPHQSSLPEAQGPLRDYLRTQAHAALDRRDARYEALQTPADIAAYQKELREQFIASLGGFPERTPLNARVTGTLVGDGFRVEKVIFESLPGFHVTANLYLPPGPGPHAAVLMPCGHTVDGKAGYQRAAITMVQNGLAVFCFDPIGQGERKQIPHSGQPLNATSVSGDPRHFGPFNPTTEHNVLSIAAVLLGRNLATYMIWDGIRALDYLESRADIDAKRIGCSGNSGGGMMTSYLMALDQRVACAAPGCFITTSRRKNEKPGPGDGEQNVAGQYVYGFDHPDFLILQAPRPVLICSATRDYVPIEGAWEAFRQAKRVYARLGYAERVDLIETDATHGFSLQLREGATRWMRRWLLRQDDAAVERPASLFPGKELCATPRGQVLWLEGARSLPAIYREEAAKLAGARASAWRSLDDAGRRAVVRRTVAVRPLGELSRFQVESRGTVQRPGYTIEKRLITPEDGVPLPALHFRPEKPSGRAVLFVSGLGKDAASRPGGAIEEMMREGAEVLAVDLRGFGETAMRTWRYQPAEISGQNGAEAAVAYMLGRPLAGMRAEDTLIAAQVLARAPDGSRRRIELIATDEAAIPALHAAALEPQLFAEVQLRHAIDSWQRVIDVDVPLRQSENAVHGALRHYDLPDLVPLAGTRVTYIDRVDGAGKPIRR